MIDMESASKVAKTRMFVTNVLQPKDELEEVCSANNMYNYCYWFCSIYNWCNNYSIYFMKNYRIEGPKLFRWICWFIFCLFVCCGYLIGQQSVRQQTIFPTSFMHLSICNLGVQSIDHSSNAQGLPLGGGGALTTLSTNVTVWSSCWIYFFTFSEIGEVLWDCQYSNSSAVREWGSWCID